MNKDKQSAQQIIEVLLLFATVIVVILFVTGPRGPFRPAVNSVISLVIDQIGEDHQYTSGGMGSVPPADPTSSPDGFVPACTSNCVGKECGPDGCGDPIGCGTCPSGFTCNNYQCEPICSCDGKQCGDDGCGHECGPCPCAGNQCVDYQCVCSGICTGNECGLNDCCISCGDCSLFANTVCISDMCVCTTGFQACNPAAPHSCCNLATHYCNGVTCTVKPPVCSWVTYYGWNYDFWQTRYYDPGTGGRAVFHGTIVCDNMFAWPYPAYVGSCVGSDGYTYRRGSCVTWCVGVTGIFTIQRYECR